MSEGFPQFAGKSVSGDREYWLDSPQIRGISSKFASLTDRAGIEPAPVPPPNPAFCSSFSETPCEIWPGALNSKGYGVRTINSKRWLSHRAAYVAAGGTLEPGTQLHHVCGERRCVNPKHLVQVTATEHNRGHLGRESATEFLLRVLGDGEPQRIRDVVAEQIAHTDFSLRIAVGRAAKKGLLHRVSWGVYQKALS